MTLCFVMKQMNLLRMTYNYIWLNMNVNTEIKIRTNIYIFSPALVVVSIEGLTFLLPLQVAWAQHIRMRNSKV